jgi:hypothetical protein
MREEILPVPPTKRTVLGEDVDILVVSRGRGELRWSAVT